MIQPPVPLGAGHDLEGFDCGEPALNDWLKRRALANESRFSRTYVVCADGRVVAFHGLAAGAVARGAAPAPLRRNAPDVIPVAVLGRLAVDHALAGHGLGRDLLADAFRRVASASATLGLAALLVHAKDDRARAFYLRCAEFLEYPADSRTLFLPIATLLAAVGEISR